MKISFLFQYLFDLPVSPAKVLLALYISPVSTAKKIMNLTGISYGKTYQSFQFLEKKGFIDRSKRGIIKLKTDIVDSKIREGINDLNIISNNLLILKKRAIKESFVRENLEKDFVRS